MNEIVLNDIYGVTERKGIPVVSSRKIAEVFEKRHDVVLRTVETCGCSAEFRNHNFVVSSYREGKGKYKEYLLTKDGFAFVVMGFTGKKAAQFKEAYIKRFNEMESFIKSLYEAKVDFPEFTDAVMALHEEPKHYHFSNEINMINKIVLGMDAKKFKQVNNLGDVDSIRPYLSSKQLEYIKILQRVDIGLCVAIPDFYERKRKLAEYFNNIALKQIA